MERIKLDAQPRAVIGKQVRGLRRQGLIPGVLYGAGVEPTPIEMNVREATRVLARVRGSTLIDLTVADAAHTVLVREIQRDAIRRDLRHVDFLKVAMDVTIRASVPVEIVGEAPAVKTHSGVLVLGLAEIEVEALPGDLPDRVAVDMGQLTAIGQAITVGDLFLGKGVRVLTDADELVARVTAQAAEEAPEVEAVPTAVEPELIEKPRREDEEEEGGE